MEILNTYLYDSIQNNDMLIFIFDCAKFNSDNTANIEMDNNYIGNMINKLKIVKDKDIFYELIIGNIKSNISDNKYILNIILYNNNNFIYLDFDIEQRINNNHKLFEILIIDLKKITSKIINGYMDEIIKKLLYYINKYIIKQKDIKYLLIKNLPNNLESYINEHIISDEPYFHELKKNKNDNYYNAMLKLPGDFQLTDEEINNYINN